jgi:PEP-CTERM motif
MMHVQRLLKTIAVLSTGLLFQATAHAAVIASTLDAGLYKATGGQNVSGSASFVGETEIATPFTSSGNYSVDQIDVGLTNNEGTNSAVVGLWTDVGGIPTVELGSWNVSNQPAFGSTGSVLTSITGISGINLVSGGHYFITIFPGASDTWDVWNGNLLGIAGADFSTNGGASWTQQANLDRPAFDILGTAAAVPEPATLTLFGFALFGLGTIPRRRKSGKTT